MADKNNIRYSGRRARPMYLLDRVGTDSSIDSDGASRIFKKTNSTITTAKDTDTWSTSNIPYSSSSFSVSTACGTCNTSSDYASNSFSYKSSDDMSSRYKESSETRSIQREHEKSKRSTTSSNLPMCLMKSDNPIEDGFIVDYNYDPSRGPENMFGPPIPYRPLSPVKEDKPQQDRESNNLTGRMNSEEIKGDNGRNVSEGVESLLSYYGECCLWGNRSLTICGNTSRPYSTWILNECISFSVLKSIDTRSYLKRIGVISKEEEDELIMNERNLIANRLRSKDIFIDDSMVICPKHRSSFGVDWHDSKSKCHHRDHDPKHHPSARDCRRANTTICSKIEGFPVGGRLCSKHRKEVQMIPDSGSVGPISIYSHVTNGSEFIIDNSRDLMNHILPEINLSPIWSQTRKNLDKCSDSGLRRIISKLNSSVKVFQEKMAEALAPGQSEQLLEISELNSKSRSTLVSDRRIGDEMVQNLKRIYDVYVEQKMPFIEQVRLLSLLPRSWDYEKIIKIFGASRHAIKTAHRMYDEQIYILENDDKPCIRQRADPEMIKHFVNWLVESNTLVSGTYGLTVLRMDNGERQEIPRQILQLQKNHAILNYKKYCEETNCEGLGTRKLYDILNSIKPAQQQAVAGLDEFVVEGVESWRSLSTMVEEMPIPQAVRKRLLKQMESAEHYQKSRHIEHCSANSNCITHCTTFALSDPTCDAQYMACIQEHTSICTDCLNVIQTLDEVKEKIAKISDQDLQAEVAYDFENASEHIIEWFRHNIRAAQQDFGKTRIISEMGTDEAFCTFDWGQKILPQEYRESQKKYFGKKGMSVLIGSFIWKNQPTSPIMNSTTTAIQFTPIFSSKSYILALTNAAQTELDTLSGGELILKQFKADYPHIHKLHKRTDNASNFSSHATPEAEKVICQSLGIELLTRDYSEVQKGKDICDRICGVAKERMRSWIAAGNNLLNAHDIKEGMEYIGGVKNTKIAVAEIIPGAGHVDKTNIPNVSSVRSVRYGQKTMKVYKASNIGRGVTIRYKAINFENNMKVTSSFTASIDEQSAAAIPKRKDDRRYYDLSLCPVNGCTATFESNTELDAHISSNLHTIPDQVPRTANDVARMHLTEIVRTTRSRTKARAIFQNQDNTTYDLSTSFHFEFFSTSGWALRARKQSKPMSDKVKTFLEQIWLDSIKTNTRIIPENIQQQIRTQRDQAGKKIFQTHEYPSKNQIKYQCRKFNEKYDVSSKQQLIAEIIDEHIDSQ